MVDRGGVKGVDIAPNTSTNDSCVGCVLGKPHRTPIPKVSNSRSTKLLQLVHSDVSGPIEGNELKFSPLVDLDTLFHSSMTTPNGLLCTSCDANPRCLRVSNCSGLSCRKAY